MVYASTEQLKCFWLDDTKVILILLKCEMEHCTTLNRQRSDGIQPCNSNPVSVFKIETFLYVCFCFKFGLSMDGLLLNGHIEKMILIVWIMRFGT